jgi:hypothetical protein
MDGRDGVTGINKNGWTDKKTDGQTDHRLING